MTRRPNGLVLRTSSRRPWLSRPAGPPRRLLAHVQAAEALAAALGLPRVPLRIERSSPSVIEASLGDQPATIIRPPRPGPWPSVLFANGATPDGRAHPVVRQLGVALARSGFAVYVPDLPGVADGVLTPETLAAATRSASRIADGPDARGGRVGLVGVSVGGTLALLVAASSELVERVSVVACIAPYSDLERVIELATTGTYRSGGPGPARPYPVPDELANGHSRSLEELVPAGADATVGALLANRDPGRFDELYHGLPASVREAVLALSPRHSVDRIRAPVEIATAPRDRYFPLEESLALMSNPRVRVTVTPTLAHARPHVDARNLLGLVQLERFFVRTLLAVRG